LCGLCFGLLSFLADCLSGDGAIFRNHRDSVGGSGFRDRPALALGDDLLSSGLSRSFRCIGQAGDFRGESPPLHFRVCARAAQQNFSGVIRNLNNLQRFAGGKDLVGLFGFFPIFAEDHFVSNGVSSGGGGSSFRFHVAVCILFVWVSRIAPGFSISVFRRRIEFKAESKFCKEKNEISSPFPRNPLNFNRFQAEIFSREAFFSPPAGSPTPEIIASPALTKQKASH